MHKKKTRYIVTALLIIVAVAVFLSAFYVLDKYVGKGNEESHSGEDSVVTLNGVDYLPNNNINTFLFIGLDAFSTGKQEEYNDYKQADFLLLFVFDNDSRKFSAIHINRDTMTEVNRLAMDGSKVDTVKEQIALAHTEGNGKEVSCRNTADAVSRLLLGVDVDYYASFTMDALPKINDSVGGVTVTFEDDLTSVDPAFIKGQSVKLKGSQALSFVRARGGLTDATNITRMSRQREYMNNLFPLIREKVKSDDDYLKTTFLDISDAVVTNRSLNQFQHLSDKFTDYTFAGFVDIKGESKVGEKYMEFYPDRAELEQTVIDLFYKKK